MTEPLRANEATSTELDRLRTRVAELERQKASAATNAARYELLLDHLNVGVFVTNVEGRILEANRRVVEIGGAPNREAFLSRSADMLYANPDDRTRMLALLLRDSFIRNLEAQTQCWDGAQRWVSISAILTEDPITGQKLVIGMIEDIHDRKMAEFAVLASESRFRHLYESMRDAYARVQMDGKLIEFNQVYSQLLGYSSDELRRLTYTDLTPAKWHAMEADVITNQVLVRGYSDLYEKEYYRKDGTLLSVELLTSLLRGPNGEPESMWAIIRDVTERRRIEDALRSSEARFRVIAEQSLLGIAIMQDDCIVYANQAVSEINGYSIAEIQTWHTSDFARIIHASDLEFAVEQAKKKMAGNPSALSHYAYRLITKTGETRWVDQYSRTIEHSGRPANFITLVDITARKAAEASLAAETERLSITLRNIADGVISTNRAGNIVLMNHAAELLTGVTQVSAATRSIEEVLQSAVDPNDARSQQVLETVLRAADSAVATGQLQLSGHDGRQRTVSLYVTPLLPQFGEAHGVVVAIRDITEELRYADSLQRAAKLESLGVLAAGIAHDFNNLLSGLFGHIDMAKDSAPKSSETRTHLDLALQVFGRAKSLSNQLLAFAKGNAPVRIVGSISATIKNSVQFALSGANVSTIFNIAPNLWQVAFDEHQIAQVIDNLVINALQAMPNGGTLTVSASNVEIGDTDFAELDAGRYVRVTVKDEGVGMAPETIQRIFDPFFTTKQHGSGLGLAATYAIVKRHKGTIEVESKPGHGSSFFLLFPATAEAPRVTATPTTSSDVGHGTVLLMDDDPAVLRVTAMMLKRLGYQVTAASDGKEAISEMSKLMSLGEPVTAVLLDLTVREGLGGREAVAQLHKLAPDVPLVAISGYAEDPVMATPRNFGFTDSLKKPFLTTDLGNLFGRIQSAQRTPAKI